MSPVKMEKETFLVLKNCGIVEKAESAKSGGASQYRYPNLEAGTLAFWFVVCSFELVAYGLQHRYCEQFASLPTS